MSIWQIYPMSSERTFGSKILNGAPENGYFTYVAEDESGEVIGFASGGEERPGDPVYKGDLMDTGDIGRS